MIPLKYKTQQRICMTNQYRTVIERYICKKIGLSYSPQLSVFIQQKTDNTPCPESRYLLSIFLIGISFSVILSLFLHKHFHKELQNEFVWAASERFNLVHRSAQEMRHILENIQLYFEGTEWVGKENFNHFVTPVLHRLPGIRFFAWIAMANAEDGRYIQEAKKYTNGFTTEQNDDFTVFYLEPYAGNERFLGFNIGCNASWSKTLHQVIESGLPMIMEGSLPIKHHATEVDLMVLSPIYRAGQPHNTPEERRTSLQGFIWSGIDMDVMLHGLLDSLVPRGINFVLLDDAHKLIYEHASRLSDDARETVISWPEKTPEDLHFEKNFSLFDQQWSFVAFQNKKSFPLEHTFGPWIVLVIGILITFLTAKDVIAFVQAHRIIHAMQVKMLNRSKLATLGEVATGIAHELNQPLTYISTFIQLLEMKCQQGAPLEEEEVLEGFSTSQHQLQRIDIIIQHLRTFGRDDNLLAQTAATEVCPGKILDNALLLMGERIRLKNIRLERHEEADVQITGNANQLEQVFINLLQNAIHATAGHVAEPLITITMTRDPEHDGIRIVFADNGAGIPAELLDKIFEPFFTTKPVGEGTGLGLSIVYGIVHDHGGTIDCQSVAGEGTRFIIQLPRKEIPHEQNRCHTTPHSGCG
ncbi:MAG: CHASE domain-containing protein [Magnetococcales bacterium]|nr:CHASE domain-containing protein [Magnetococcales bacterium]